MSLAPYRALRTRLREAFSVHRPVPCGDEGGTLDFLARRPSEPWYRCVMCLSLDGPAVDFSPAIGIGERGGIVCVACLRAAMELVAREEEPR